MKNLLLGTRDFPIKKVCHKCKRADFCRDIDKKMRELRSTSFPVWEKEFQERLGYISAELEMLGFAYPEGRKICLLRKISYRDLLDLIHYINTIDPEKSA